MSTVSETTGVLARFAAGLRPEDVPAPARDQVRALLLDGLACALVGWEGEDTVKAQRFAAQLGASTESTVIGGDRLSLAGATVMNGFLFTAVSMCDVYRPTATHLQPVVLPPALALAERENASGGTLLAALAGGFEVSTRIARGLDYSVFRKRGWHGPGTLGPFGAAAASGRLLGFDADHMATAFGLAGSQAAGTFAAWGTPSVKFHQCRGALSGLMAALLAGQGFKATREFLTAADGGFYPVYAGAAPLAAATDRLGEDWELLQIGLRPWPTSAASQGVVTAVLDLVQRHGLAADRVKGLRIRVSKPSYDAYAGRREYRGKWEASSSIHYTAAVTLHDGDVWLDQFEEQRCQDPVLRRFAGEQVELECDATLKGVQAIVTADCTDGTTLTARCDAPLGAPENPLTQAQVEDKFRKAARGRLGTAETAAVIDAVARLEAQASVRPLLALLAGASRK